VVESLARLDLASAIFCVICVLLLETLYKYTQITGGELLYSQLDPFLVLELNYAAHLKIELFRRRKLYSFS